MRILLGLFPTDAGILARLGVIEWLLDNPTEADHHFEASLRRSPENAEIWYRRGTVLEALRRPQEALDCYGWALKHRPGFKEALHARAELMSLAGKERVPEWKGDVASSLKSRDPGACMNRALQLVTAGKVDEALAFLDRAVDLRPDFTAAHANRAAALAQLSRFPEALASYDRVIDIEDRFPGAHRNRGAILWRLGRFEDAVRSLERAVEVQESDADSRMLLGTMKFETLSILEAAAEFEDLLEKSPDNPLIQWLLAVCKLLLGNFQEGLQLHESRWSKWGVRPLQLQDKTLPLWLGAEAIDGKSILIVQEQGLGDVIQLCRLIPTLEHKGATVVLVVDPALVALVRTVSPTVKVTSTREQWPACDFYCPIFSLPLALGISLQAIPGTTPYLSADSEKRKAWRSRLGASHRMRIGLAWSGNPVHENDKNRSIPLHAFSALLVLPADFHVLQREIRAEDAEEIARWPNVHRHDEHLRDFTDTAALTEEMDVVVSVDTAVAHLAGALAKPVWILLPFVPDWRWLLDRADTPWYPSATLFRQPRRGDWDSVLQALVERLGLAMRTRQENQESA